MPAFLPAKTKEKKPEQKAAEAAPKKKEAVVLPVSGTQDEMPESERRRDIYELD